MIHQLNDLKRAIRPRDAAHNYSASSTGSTSPFLSYLDQRDRGHVTPLGGLSSSSSSGATTSAHLKWMHTAEWSSYVTFLDKWCEEIFYMLGRGATLVTAEEEEEEESPSARIRKKRCVLYFSHLFSQQYFYLHLLLFVFGHRTLGSIQK